MCTTQDICIKICSKWYFKQWERLIHKAHKIPVSHFIVIDLGAILSDLGCIQNLKKQTNSNCCNLPLSCFTHLCFPHDLEQHRLPFWSTKVHTLGIQRYIIYQYSILWDQCNLPWGMYVWSALNSDISILIFEMNRSVLAGLPAGEWRCRINMA